MLLSFFGILFGIVLGQNSYAAERVDLLSAEPNTNATRLDWPVRHEWKWVLENNETPVLYSQITLTTPSTSEITEVQGKFIHWKSEGQVATQVPAQPGRIHFLLSSLGDHITVKQKSGPDFNFDLQLLPSRQEIFAQGCDPFTLRVSPLKAGNGKVPLFPIGVYCTHKNNEVRVTVTAPEEVEWKDTTIFELNGKGERWKQYSIPPNFLSTGGEVGRLNFSYQNLPCSYVIQVRQKAMRGNEIARPLSPSKPLVDPLFTFQVGAGIGQFSQKALSFQKSLIEPGLYLAGRTRKIWDFMDFGGAVKLGLPLGSSETLSFYELQLYTGLNLSVSDWLKLAARVYFISMGSSYDSGLLTYNLNQPALGLNAKFQLSSNYALQFGIVDSGAIPASTSTALLPEFGIEFPAFGSKMLFLVHYQKYKLADTINSANSSQFNQLLFNFVYQF